MFEKKPFHICIKMIGPPTSSDRQCSLVVRHYVQSGKDKVEALDAFLLYHPGVTKEDVTIFPIEEQCYLICEETL